MIAVLAQFISSFQYSSCTRFFIRSFIDISSPCSPIPQSARTSEKPALPKYPYLCFPVKRRLLIQVIRQCFQFLPLTIL